MFGRSLTSRLVAVIAVVTSVCVVMVVVAVTWSSYRTASGAVTGRTALAASMFGFTAVVLASLVAWRLGRQLSKPVVVMAQTMRRMADGDLDVVAPPTHAATELGDMAEALEAFRTNARGRLEAEAGRRAAEKIAQDRSDFLAVMSHEIRTPMNGVLGMADALARSPMSASQRQMLDVLTASGDALLGLLNDVLDYSEIESGKLEIQRLPFELRAVVDEAAAPFAARAAEKGVALSVTASDTPGPMLVGDPGRVRQVLTNLLSNAVKFTPSGTIKVTVGAEALPEGGCRLRIAVQDTGIGIGPELEARLFQKFVQGDPSSTRAHDGAGLGLAISRELARLMGGDLTVASEKGRGSTFTLEALAGFAQPAEPECAIVDRLEAGAARPALRVLAADPDPHTRQALRILLERTGAQTTFSNTGPEAVEAWAHGAFDVILLDVRSPETEGLDAARAIRRLEAEQGWSAIPIIALAAEAQGPLAPECVAAGMDAQLGKPIRPAALFDAVEAVLGRPLQPGARKAA